MTRKSKTKKTKLERETMNSWLKHGKVVILPMPKGRCRASVTIEGLSYTTPIRSTEKDALDSLFIILLNQPDPDPKPEKVRASNTKQKQPGENLWIAILPGCFGMGKRR